MSEFVVAKIWFAFLGLQSQSEPLSIPRSKCTVITFHLQNITNVPVSDLFKETFSEEQYTHEITFDEYRKFLESEFIPKISASLRSKALDPHRDRALSLKLPSDQPSRDSQTIEEAVAAVSNKLLTKSEEELSTNVETKPTRKKSQPIRSRIGPTKIFSWKYLEEYCWLIYMKGHLHPDGRLSNFAAFMFWIIFITYARREHLPTAERPTSSDSTSSITYTSGRIAIPVIMDNEEIQYWLQRLQHRMGIELPQTSRPNLSGTSTFSEALRILEDFVDEHKLDHDVVEEALRELRREVEKNIFKKAKFLINPRLNTDRQGLRWRPCRLCHNRIILNYPSSKLKNLDGKQHTKTAAEPKRELYFPTWRVKPLDGDKSKKKLVLYLYSMNEIAGEEIILEAENSVIRNEWLSSIQMIVNFKLDNPNQLLPLEMFKFLIRSTTREARRDQELKKQMEFSETEKEKEEALRRLNDMEEKCYVLEREKEARIQDLAHKLQEMENSLQKTNSDYARIQEEYLEKEEIRQRLELRLLDLEDEKDSTVENMMGRLAEMEKIKEEKTQIEQDIRAMLNDKELQLQSLEEIRNKLENALEEERKARQMEAENVRRQEALLLQEQAARALLESLAQEKESLLANEASRREEIERKYSDEQQKVARICKEKELLREQNMEIKEQLNAKKKLLMKYPHIMDLQSHRGPGFLSKNERMKVTVEQIVTVEDVDYDKLQKLTCELDKSTESEDKRSSVINDANVDDPPESETEDMNVPSIE